MPETIDLKPTWGEVANLYMTLAERGARPEALKAMRAEVARMAAACEALNAISKTLTDEQQATVARVMTAELSKQGY